jgi:hypothetical protein
MMPTNPNTLRTHNPLSLARVGDYIEVGRGHHSVRLTRKPHRGPPEPRHRAR